jgi:hypothetical protein
MASILEYVYKADDPLVFRQLTGDILVQMSFLEDRMREVLPVSVNEIRDHPLVKRIQSYMTAWGYTVTVQAYMEKSRRKFLSVFEVLRAYLVEMAKNKDLKPHEKEFLCAEFNGYDGNKLARAGHVLKL